MESPMRRKLANDLQVENLSSEGSLYGISFPGSAGEMSGCGLSGRQDGSRQTIFGIASDLGTFWSAGHPSYHLAAPAVTLLAYVRGSQNMVCPAMKNLDNHDVGRYVANLNRRVARPGAEKLAKPGREAQHPLRSVSQRQRNFRRNQQKSCSASGC